MFFQWVTQKAQKKKSEYWPTGVEIMTFWLVGHHMLYLKHQQLSRLWIGLCFGNLRYYTVFYHLKENNKRRFFYSKTQKTNKPVHFVLLTSSFIIIIICKTTETLIFKVNNNVVPGLL